MAKRSTKNQKVAEAGEAKKELKSLIKVSQTRSDRIAIWITDIFGTLSFLVLCLLTFLIYFLWNLNLIPGLKVFDEYPFYALDTVLAVFAVTLSISVLISQNRQRRMEKIKEQVEFEVNVRAETEITKILEMLHAIQQKLHIDKPDNELEEMKEALDLEQIHKDAGGSSDTK